MITYHASPVTGKRVRTLANAVLLSGVLADQASKSWASLWAAEPRFLLPGYLAAYSVANAGGPFNLADDRPQTCMVLAWLSIACAALLVRIACVDREGWQGAKGLATALLLAGLFGNTMDRLALGHVRDFLVIWAMPRYAFNVADLLGILGFAFLCLARFGGWRRTQLKIGFTG
jgi:lipoprotein signal peptidase